LPTDIDCYDYYYINGEFVKGDINSKIREINCNEKMQFWVGTQKQYDAIPAEEIVKDCVYITIDGVAQVDHAANADHASNADYATNAGSATSCANANYAINATNADYATNAGNANNANNAKKAETATHAETAFSARTDANGTVIDQAYGKFGGSWVEPGANSGTPTMLTTPGLYLFNVYVKEIYNDFGHRIFGEFTATTMVYWDGTKQTMALLYVGVFSTDDFEYGGTSACRLLIDRNGSISVQRAYKTGKANTGYYDILYDNSDNTFRVKYKKII
jgi:hypothetical protein